MGLDFAFPTQSIHLESVPEGLPGLPAAATSQRPL
jgi:hypothetical protein